jgi:hypothetical protein
VVLDPQQDARPAGARHTPYIDGVHHVTEVQVTCRGWGESRDQVPNPKVHFQAPKARSQNSEPEV